MRLLLDIIEVAVLAGTALIVWRYTRETINLRQAAQQQNQLIAEQVRLAQRADERATERYHDELKRQEAEVERQKSLLEPLIESRGGTSRSDSAEVKFVNSGGAVRHVEVVPQAGFTATISPENTIPTGREGRFAFKGVDGDQKSPFLLRYEIATGDKREKLFYYWKGNVYEGAV